jgi:hypothetical protein
MRAKARGHRDLVTIVGHAAVISAAEWITASGEWVNDRTHGQQFRAKFLKTSAPTSIDGIERYLASGMIRGIGPAYAKNLIRAFGDKVFDVIEGGHLGPSRGPCGRLRMNRDRVADGTWLTPRLDAHCFTEPDQPREEAHVFESATWTSHDVGRDVVGRCRNFR